MKVLRPFIWAGAMVAAFLYVTSAAHWDIGRVFRPGGMGRLWSEPASAASVGTFMADEQNNIDVYRGARDATVNITSVVYRETWFSAIYPEQGAGSGFIVSPDGEILTNNHVVNGGTAQLTVVLADKKSFKAKILFTDPRDDLALIKINAGRKLPSLRLGDSEATVVGQKVLAIGNPFGFGGTLTTGIVSSLGRTIQTEDNRELEGMVQTDAAINPGNSGGPLLDSHGNVIGINTAIYGAQGNIGLGFAIPINRAKAILDEFQQKGHISRPTLGIETSYVAGDLAEVLNLPASGGLLVRRVERPSPAAAAGLRGPSQWVIRYNYRLPVGADLITALDGQPVEGIDSLQRVMNRKHGGDMLEMTIYRDGRSEKVRVKLGEAPQQ
ncbi:MAG: trypsin-like peptidase domain-containing protein [Acidobacteriia bacterium]|nr:trypsin-like peptidase domain-containing protein [Terriglobia bacterium]